jgi:hypothetical protein
MAPADFPDLDIPNTPNHILFGDINFEGWDEEWVKRWRTFTSMEEDSANGVDNEDPFPLLGIHASQSTPEHGDNYVHASIMLPRGSSFAQGKVTSQKCDACGNPIGCANNNPILDPCMYCIEFDDGNLSELTTNVIAELMYPSYNDGGKEFLMMDCLSTITPMPMLCPRRASIWSIGDTILCLAPLWDGTCVSSGRVGPPPDSL